MRIEATLENSVNGHSVVVKTNSVSKTLTIPQKSEGRGSGINGGELLFTAIATCYCNDIYREAARRNIEVRSIQVAVDGEFGNEGEPARTITYSVKIDSPAPQQQVSDLILFVDRIAEIHNTLRQGIAVSLVQHP
jgi:uncharacterized OsmC-like protein